MAIKKSELYQSLWTSCDALRATGGMDSSQYKDYVLTMLFIKYISDKYTGKEEIITIPKGSSFEDMVALKGQKDIGDKINKQIIRPIFRENGLEGEVELVDFNDDDKLGSDKEKVDLLDGLIGIFENPALNFKNNRAEDDDILGDAYEFLMRHFATESGKSKGQFYTPAEVSRVLAKIIDMHEANSSQFSVYDPTCGSGSLLLKVAQEAPDNLDEISIAGQEKDNAVKSLAVMNMWMHGYESAIIKKGNSISSPYHKDKEGKLKRFDRVVANPPFSQKSWSQGINPLEDEFNRFLHYGVPPDKNGDYAFLLHIIASLKGNGKAAVILPHGVLFRGNAEAEIRQNLIERKYIKGIVGLPANLFYGTGIPACILVIDKANAETSEGVFMIDASKGFIKDGNKNRLREQDIHKIVDVFNAQKDTDKYARFVYYDEIIGNEYNLNIPRYIDTQEEEDIQDLDAHINGGIPDRDIEGMQPYWQVYPNLKSELFEPMRPSYSQLKSQASEIKEAIFNHHEFKAYRNEMDQLFDHWQQNSIPTLKSIHIETAPKKLIHHISEDLLTEYSNKALVDRYDMYQHLMDYWLAVMKDDTYMIIEDGWVAKLYIVKQTKKETVYDCDLVPKYLVVNRYFSGDLAAIQVKEAEKETKENEFATLIEDHSGEESIFEEVENGKVSKAELTYKLKEYEDLAFGTHFPSDFSNYSATVDTLADLESAIKDMIDGDYWGMYFEKLANAKGKLVKGNIQNRILDLKQQISSSDLPDQYQAQAETITKAFEKVDWEYGIKNPWFAELDVLHDYVSKLAKQTALKKSIRQQRESLLAQLAHIMDDATKDYINEIKVIQQLIALNELIASLGSKIKEAYKVLEEKTIKKYRELSEEDVKTLVVGDKWMTTLAKNIQNEIDEISQRLTGRIKELADRYDSTMKELSNGVDDYEMKVRSHLAKMGIDV